MTDRTKESIVFVSMVVVYIFFVGAMVWISAAGYREPDCDIKYIGARFNSFSYQLEAAKPKTFMSRGQKWVVMSKDYYDSHMKCEAE